MGMRNEFNYRWENPVKIRSCQYLNNIVEQDHRRVKFRLQTMLGSFQRFYNARRVLAGVELAQQIHKGQFAVPTAFGSNAAAIWRKVLAAQLMRRILVDHARSRAYLKRGGSAPVISLDEAVEVAADPSTDLLAIDELVIADQTEGFEYLLQAMDEMPSFKSEALQFIRDRFPDLRNAPGDMSAISSWPS
jgi:hypothetical protein